MESKERSPSASASALAVSTHACMHAMRKEKKRKLKIRFKKRSQRVKCFCWRVNIWYIDGENSIRRVRGGARLPSPASSREPQATVRPRGQRAAIGRSRQVRPGPPAEAARPFPLPSSCGSIETLCTRHAGNPVMWFHVSHVAACCGLRSAAPGSRVGRRHRQGSGRVFTPVHRHARAVLNVSTTFETHACTRHAGNPVMWFHVSHVAACCGLRSE